MLEDDKLAALGHDPADTLCLLGGLGPAYARWLDPALAPALRAPRGSSLDGALILAQRRGEGADHVERVLGQQATLSVVIEFAGGLLFLFLLLRRRPA